MSAAPPDARELGSARSGERRVLVANRGEIAVRILRTCRRLGLHTVAVASDADLAAPHAGLADRVVRLGGPAPKDSYLRVDRIVDAGLSHGATDVHPGFGFLAESAPFARAVAAAGMRFVGPSPEAIEAMGSKIGCRESLARAGVSPVPGTPVDDADDPRLTALLAAGSLRYPLLVKAAAGGGGKGMRRVDGPKALPGALEACRREAEAAFGDGALLVERLVEGARHVEVQVFGDCHGAAVALLDRDCSVQRRHQKVLEECPAPGLSAATRAGLHAAAVAVARSVAYTGAGTVEFLVEPDGTFHFLEMNTRLQVEHAVTELVTGLDLVEWQLRVAAGEPLPADWERPHAAGHAVEARLYAEDPQGGFLPSVGRLHALRLPQGPGVRVDSGVAEGDEVTAWYDPMLAKIAVWGADRPAALGRLSAALAEAHVLGVRSNLEMLRWLLDRPEVRAGVATTAFLEAAVDDFVRGPGREATPDEVAAAAAAIVLSAAPAPRAGVGAGDGAPPGPWACLGAWRL